MQFVLKSRMSDELQKCAVLVGRDRVSSPPGESTILKLAQTLPVAQVPVRAVAGVAGGGEDAGSPVQAGSGLAGTVPELTALARKQAGADAGVTWRG